MKIGILTFHRGINAGGFLQAKGLSSFLMSLGHQVELLDYTNAAQKRLDHEAIYRTRHPIRLLNNIRKQRSYLKAIATLPMGATIQSAEGLSALDYDCLVFGSDEIWNICNPFSAGDRTFFGAGMGAGLKISYAPSFGSTPPDDPRLASLSLLLAEFDAISVRDENSVAIVESLTGRRPDLVVDPVLLSGPDTPIQNSKTAGAIGTYLMGPSEHDVQRISRFASGQGKTLCSIGYHYSWAARNIASPHPADVPGLLAGCDLVVTNTFHGVVFSLKNRLPFIIMSHPSKDRKIETFRRRLGLSTVTDEMEEIQEDHVNQLSPGNQLLAGWIDESKGFLEKHLSA
jgi:hypothetical protein